MVGQTNDSKAAFITNYWEGSGYGGMRTYSVNIVDALRKEGMEVDVIFREGLDPRSFSGGKNKFFFTINCLRYLKKLRPEMIYSQSTWYCLLPGVLYKKLNGCKLVFTFHTEPTDKLSTPARIAFQKLLDACDCITFVSQGLQNKLIELDNLLFSKTSITYSGVNKIEVTEEEARCFRKRHGIEDGDIMLLTLGMTALRHKAEGLKLLIRAVKVLRDTYPNLTLVVTKDGIYSEELKSFTRDECMEENVIFVGNVGSSHVALEACDLYTHITLGEGGLSIALLEAMSMAKPIVATSVGGIPEAILHGKNGILVAPEVGQIANQIDFLLRNREYAIDLGTCAKRTVEKKFTWKQAAEGFLRCYPEEKRS